MRSPRTRVVLGLACIGILLVACGSGDADDVSGGEAEAATSDEADAGVDDDPDAAVEGNPTECVDEAEHDGPLFVDQVSAEHARGWDVRYEDTYKVLATTVTAAAGHAVADDRVIESTYVLVQCGTEPPPLEGDLADAHVVTVPVDGFVDGGSIFYAAVEQLGVAPALLGEAEPFLHEVEAPYFPQVMARMDAGEVREIGYEANLEVLAEIAPDFYTNYAGDDTMFEGIEGLGIPVVLFFPYSETPLGAAEHVKFLSLFFNLEAEANRLFDDVEQRYEDVRAELDEHVATLDEAPSVLVGVLGDDAMTTRQRERFEPELIRDAGALPVPDLPGGGIGTIAIESALDLASDADLWIDLAFFPPGETVEDYLAADARVERIPALQDGRAMHRMGSRGNDYFLHGAFDVDVMLRDLASQLYPELFPDHEPEFLQPIAP